MKNTWHPTFIDYMDIEIGEKLREGMYEVRCPRAAIFGEEEQGGKKKKKGGGGEDDVVMVAKFARFDWEIQYMENETTAYRWIEGHGDIGPRFLDHLTEGGGGRNSGSGNSNGKSHWVSNGAYFECAISDGQR